jgi:ZIP family zinc transporter
MPTWLAAGLWGLLAGGALVIGAAIAWSVNVPQRVVAGIMAFGSGVLISALSFDLVDEAIALGGLWPTLGGFLLGAVMYVVANQVLAARGARHRKRSGDQQADASEPGSGTAIAVGALLDGVPESVVLGISLIGGHGVLLFSPRPRPSCLHNLAVTFTSS